MISKKQMITKLTGRFRYIEGWEGACVIKLTDGTLVLAEIRDGVDLLPHEASAIAGYIDTVRQAAGIVPKPLAAKARKIGR